MPEDAPVTSAVRPPRPACSIARLFPLVRSAGGTYRTVAGATRERQGVTVPHLLLPFRAPRATRKDRAGRLLVVAGADGHRAVLTVRLDGTLLDTPHLVVPADRCGARYVSAVTGVRLVRPGVPVAAGGERLVSGAG
ncbi:hypothetical protein [Streptomyces sp. KE1]|uniref:hypothetical protein n=1 Tax=Streptomyces sp. KE1 TaxID=1638939 RepID=UPI001F1F21A7|nr:hypothetical protein [Streptomyces sp. KE1]